MKTLVKRLLLLIAVFCMGSGLVMASTEPSQTTAAQAPAAQLRIGVLDWQQVLTKAPQAEAARKRLESKFSGKKEQLMSMQKDFQSKSEKMQRDRDVMKEADRSKLEKELTKLQQDLRRLDEEFRAEYTSSFQEERDEFVKGVVEVVEKLAAEEKYDLVLSQETTVFMADRIDITEKVLKLLSKKGGFKASDKDAKK